MVKVNIERLSKAQKRKLLNNKPLRIRLAKENEIDFDEIILTDEQYTQLKRNSTKGKSYTLKMTDSQIEVNGNGLFGDLLKSAAKAITKKGIEFGVGKLNDKIDGLGAVKKIDGGFIQALLPFVVSTVAPMVIDAIKNKIEGRGMMRYDEEIIKPKRKATQQQLNNLAIAREIKAIKNGSALYSAGTRKGSALYGAGMCF